MTDEEVELAHEWYEAGTVEWDVMLEQWYSLEYFDSAAGEVRVWAPPFPGAPRRLSSDDLLLPLHGRVRPGVGCAHRPRAAAGGRALHAYGAVPGWFPATKMRRSGFIPR